MKTNANELRAALTKLLPGYKWTVHRPAELGETLYLKATGTQSSGFNRLSTIEVEQKFTIQTGGSWYEAKIMGYGLRGGRLASGGGSTLAQAVRCLQDSLERKAQIYASQAQMVEAARLLKEEKKVTK